MLTSCEVEKLPPARFVAFDGLRGILAILVVVYHACQLADRDWLPHAWIAVDVFFLMSGFVIFAAYQPKIAQGMGFWRFAKSRLTRLYPMYLVGTLLGFVALSADGTFSEAGWQRTSYAVFNALWILPYFNSDSWLPWARTHVGIVFPVNDPAWSLFFELSVNIAFFFLAKRSNATLIVSFIVSAAIYIGWGFHAGWHHGWSTTNFLGGFPRVCAFFFAGCLLYVIHLRLPPVRPITAACVLVALIGAICVQNNRVTIFALLVITPVVVAAASRVDNSCFSVSFVRVAKLLGLVSYPLYIVHYPILRLCTYLIGSDMQAIFRIAPPVVFSLLLAAAATAVDLKIRKRQLPDKRLSKQVV